MNPVKTECQDYVLEIKVKPVSKILEEADP
jgi:hypothetical protein